MRRLPNSSGYLTPVRVADGVASVPVDPAYTYLYVRARHRYFLIFLLLPAPAPAVPAQRRNLLSFFSSFFLRSRMAS